MARRWQAPNPLPAHYQRDMLDEPVPCRIRKINDTDGRGDNWQKGNLHGWDSHGVDEPAPIVYVKCGGWRTLDLSIWEIK